jgi:hypothetical protein
MLANRVGQELDEYHGSRGAVVRVSEIIGSRASEAPNRCVGVEYPPSERYRVMSAAVDLYRMFGVDAEVDGLRISVPCTEAFATPLIDLLEYRTGHPAFNEWRRTRPS